MNIITDAIPDLPASLSAIGTAFGLAGPLDVVSFHDGASGAWRLTTNNGDIGVKVLPADSPDYKLDELRVAADLETRARDAGLPIVPPIVPTEPAVGLAARIGDWLVWAHEWIEENEGPEPLALQQWVGSTAARLHMLWSALRNQDDALAHAYGLHGREEWQGWIDDAYRADLAWTTDVTEALPAILEASRLARAALRDTRLGRCISHRDLNPNNVLFAADGPLLCDFGYSGIEVPWLELVDAAHSFDQAGPVTIEAYRDAGGEGGPETTEALARETGATMNFLAFSMWLSLGHRDVSEEQREEATARVPALARNLTAQVEAWEATRRLLFGR